MQFAIYGTGGFAREVYPLLHDIWLRGEAMLPGEAASMVDVVFVDDAAGAPEMCNDAPVVDFTALASEAHKHRKVVVAIGNGETRRKVENKCLDAGLTLHTLVAPTARRLSAVEIGPGSVVCDGVVLTSNVKIGRSFHANLHSYVAHDCIIGDYVTFAPRVSCNGNVRIGDHVYVGTGAMFIQGTPEEPLTIGEGSIVGMGAVVTKPVEPFTLVAGNPARMVRRL